MCTFHIDSLNLERSFLVLSGCFFSWRWLGVRRHRRETGCRARVGALLSSQLPWLLLLRAPRTLYTEK